MELATQLVDLCGRRCGAVVWAARDRALSSHPERTADGSLLSDAERGLGTIAVWHNLRTAVRGTILSRISLSGAGSAVWHRDRSAGDGGQLRPYPCPATGTRVGSGAGDIRGRAGVDHYSCRHQVGRGKLDHAHGI